MFSLNADSYLAIILKIRHISKYSTDINRQHTAIWDIYLYFAVFQEMFRVNTGRLSQLNVLPCITLDSLYYLNLSVSPVFPLYPLHLLVFTCIPQYSPVFTTIHLCSHLFTCIYVYSPVFTCNCVYSSDWPRFLVYPNVIEIREKSFMFYNL